MKRFVNRFVILLVIFILILVSYSVLDRQPPDSVIIQGINHVKEMYRRR